MLATLLTLHALAAVTGIRTGVSFLQVSTRPLVATSAGARHPEEEDLDPFDRKSTSGNFQVDEGLEVIVRHHPARQPPAEVMSRRRRRVEPPPGDPYRQNLQKELTGDSDQYHSVSVINQPLKDRGPSAGPLPAAPERSKPLVPPGASPGLEPPRAHVLELIIGVLIGILVCLLILLAWLGCWPRLKAQSAAVPVPALPPDGLDGGRLGLVQFHYQGAFFNQLSWTFERGSAARDREGDYVTVVLNERSQKVAHGVGRLMSTPNGEMHLMSLGAGAGGLWCMLKRPAPSRRPGQLWDFKVCKANGVPYSEVRQRSETKCLVNDAATQRRVMTVIGNFTYPVFLSGERSIHVWITQADGQSCMGAQCEAKLEDEGSGEINRSMASAAEGALPAAPSRRFYVTTTANADASLVLAVLLGLQDVHRAATRGEMPEETSSPSTSSGWQRGCGRGTRISSGGSTAATSAAASREAHFESAKAAPYPP